MLPPEIVRMGATLPLLPGAKTLMLLPKQLPVPEPMQQSNGVATAVHWLLPQVPTLEPVQQENGVPAPVHTLEGLSPFATKRSPLASSAMPPGISSIALSRQVPVPEPVQQGNGAPADVHRLSNWPTIVTAGVMSGFIPIGSG